MDSSRSFKLFAAIAFLVAGSFAPTEAANILIVAGTDGLAQAAANVLNTDLSGTNTVTIVNTGVPASLVGFTQIYDVRFNNNPAFTPAEMTQYLAFLNAAPGNTLFLIGENAGFSFRNGPVNNFITLAGGGTIPSPVTSSTASEIVNPPFNRPNAIGSVSFAACGLVTTPGSGAFASQEAGGGCAIYFTQRSLANAQGGALAVVYDVNFISSAPTGDRVNEVPFRLNLEGFVAAPPAAPLTSVPALSTWAQILMALALCAAGVFFVRRHALT